jgi:hypothetical protein
MSATSHVDRECVRLIREQIVQVQGETIPFGVWDRICVHIAHRFAWIAAGELSDRDPRLLFRSGETQKRVHVFPANHILVRGHLIVDDTGDDLILQHPRRLALRDMQKDSHLLEGQDFIVFLHERYKRYSARVKVRQIKEADFKRWRYEALQKRDACSRGEITPEELVDWMEAAFPNRKKKEE